MDRNRIELNDQFRRALALLDRTEQSVFITGRAGTGKSTLLQLFRDSTKKRVAVLAPTGVAALNVQGQTVHSFFGFKPDVTIEKAKALAQRTRKRNLYRQLEAIVMDEVSMVRADLLDCVDVFLRTVRPARALPFGGVQMVFIGDLYQLPPVVTRIERDAFRRQYASGYFFEADAFGRMKPEFIELEKIYRQQDPAFIAVLNAIRNNTVEDAHLARLNARLDPSFEPPSDGFYVHLTPRNDAAQAINDERLARLPGKPKTYRGFVEGSFPDKDLPTTLALQVKPGAQVMVLTNNASGRWVNGTVGKIVRIERGKGGEADRLWVERDDGKVVDVLPHTWDLFSYRFNERTRGLETEVLGSFTQYPLKLAWAVTIHKSQGKTFAKVIIDLGRGVFAPGQTYVALSRCTSLEGIVLKTPIEKRHVFTDWRIVRFLTAFQYQRSEEQVPLKEKVRLLESAIGSGSRLAIVYLKASDEKSRRVIEPKFVGECSYEGKTFIGVEAYCHSRRDRRVFRVDRILEMKLLGEGLRKQQR